MKWLKAIGKRARPVEGARGLILLYHHIDQADTDPWEMAVTPDHFRSQLEVLKSAYDVLPLSALNGERHKTFSRPAIFLTFDDAYADNYHTAFPLLKQFELPATFFVATQILNESTLFWWEVLEELLLAREHLPPRLCLRLPEGDYHREIAPYEKMRGWSAWSNKTENQRQEVYLELAALLKEATPDVQQDTTQQLLSWAGKDFRPSRRTAKMNAGQLKEVQRSGLIEIGAHSVHHPALGHLKKDQQQHEIKTSKHTLEQLLDSPVNAFAYPHGHCSPLTKSLLQASGFAIGCTTEEACLSGHSDPLALPRIWVRNWNREQFAFQVNKWLTGI